MITLYGFGEHFGLKDASPFVLKIDLLMKMANIEFTENNGSEHLQKAPKGKLPFIEDNGKIIADSYFIYKHLQRNHNLEIDSNLNAAEKAQVQVLTRYFEEHLYWCLVYSRWVREDTWQVIRPAFFDSMPFPLNKIIPIVARRDVKASLKKQGMGRHSDTEIYEIFTDALDSLSALLGDKPYFINDKPCSLDVVAYANLAQFILVDINNPFNSKAKEYKNLVDFCNKMHQAYYSK